MIDSLRRAIAPLIAVLVGLVGGVVHIGHPTAAAAAPRTVTTYQAPLIEEVAADPSITFHAGNYHLLYNKWGWHESDRRYDFTQQIVARVAPSLAGLTDAADRVVYDGARNPAAVRYRVGLGAWLLHWGTRWYLYGWGDDGASVTHSKPFVLESTGDDPLGPYNHKVTFSSPSTSIGGDGHGYAAAPLQIGGRLYLSQTSNGKIFLAELSNPWTLAGGWNLIAAPAASGWECANNRCLDEGGSIVVRGSRVFLVFSAGGYESPDYCVGMISASVSSNLLQRSSWTKSSGCVFRRNDAAAAYGPASMIFFKSPDGVEDWVVYHVKATTGLTGADRYLQAKKVTWRADGTPDFGQPSAFDTYQPVPSGDPGKQVWEAEDGTVVNATISSSPSFASNGKYVTGIQSATSSVEVSVSVAAAGRYLMKVWYANQNAGRATQTLRVNGGPALTVALPTPQTYTHGWGRFPQRAYVMVGVRLNAGANLLRFSTGTGTAQLDKLQLWPQVTGDGAAIAARDSTHLDVFALNGSDQVRGRPWHAPTGWGAWYPPGTTAPPPGNAGPPAAVSRLSYLIDLFVVGRDGQLWTKYWDGVWHDWFSLGTPPQGLATTGVAVAARGERNLDVYALGADRRMWSRAWTAAGGWGAWFVLPTDVGYGVPFIAATAPAAVSRRAASQLDVFTVGSDRQLWATWWDGVQWHRWYPLGAPPVGISSAPAVASRSTDKLDVYVRGSDGRLWSRAWTDATGWSAWFLTHPSGQPPGGMGSAPAAVSRKAPGAQLDVVSRAGGDIWATWWNGVGWQSWYTLGAP